MGIQAAENNGGKGFWKINNVLWDNIKVSDEVLGLIRKKKIEYLGLDPVLK